MPVIQDDEVKINEMIAAKPVPEEKKDDVNPDKKKKDYPSDVLKTVEECRSRHLKPVKCSVTGKEITGGAVYLPDRAISHEGREKMLANRAKRGPVEKFDKADAKRTPVTAVSETK